MRHAKLEHRPALKLGLDLDGVFADFNGHPDRTNGHGFCHLLVEVSDRDLFPRPWTGPTLWNYWKPLGYRTRESDAAWQAVQQRPTFWATLKPLAGAVESLAVVRLLRRHLLIEPVFLTTRPGLTAHAQSVQWLSDHGLPDATVVICLNAESKGLVARQLKLDLVVDDHPPNLLAVKMHSTARLVLFDQPWSGGQRDEVLGYGAMPIRNHEQLADKLKEWAGV